MIFSFLLPLKIYRMNKIVYLLSVLVLLIPVSEFVIQLIQYILGKSVKPQIIPKMDFSLGIPKEQMTFVVIPTILKSKDKVIDLMQKLEVYYLANKSENIYFGLLGDCSSGKKIEEPFDKEVIEEGLNQVRILNNKYNKNIFHFLYRKRVWNEKENCYLGWERKRGLLHQFNEFLINKQEGKLENFDFIVNTIENESLEIKYVITLDADTNLILNSAFELVGAMAHILNKPIIDQEKNIVVDGYGIIQPRVGVNLDISYKNRFTKIFAGSGGIDSYTNAISDIYQDNFEEGIFTGKGIYDLKVFSKVLKDRFPENTVLSHDLLEGNYLRCGLATDILVMDGYPEKYLSFMTRLSRWIRGDWQIKMWLKKRVYGKNNPLNLLAKFKIFDNLRRSLFEILSVFSIIYFYLLKYLLNIKNNLSVFFIYLTVIFPFVLEWISYIIGKRDGEKKQKSFVPKIDGVKGIFYRAFLNFGCLPYKAYISCIAIIKTLYRMKISRKNLLEWQTSEEGEKNSKKDYFSYFKSMYINIVIGSSYALFGIINYNIICVLLGVVFLVMPGIMCYISKEIKKKAKIEQLKKQDKEYVLEIGKNTWSFLYRL